MKYFLLFFLLFMHTQANAQMKIVATYPPIQSLVLQITDNIYPVELIHKKEGKHHHTELKPSQMKALQNADIIFWAGEELENHMPSAINAVAPKALSVPLIENDKLIIKQSISDPEKKDMHFWLNIDNVIASLDKIESVMSNKDPKNKEKFAKNKQKAIDHLKTLQKEAAIIPKDKKIIALHEGFDYFFDYFKLNGTTLGIEPEDLTTPMKIINFHAQLEQNKPECIIVEPSLTSEDISKLGLSNYKLQKMDAFGWNIDNGPQQLYQMMMWNFQQLKKCIEK